jgi:AraC-like DNA-binding protein
MKVSPPPTRPASGPPAFFSPDVAAARRFYLDLKPARDRRLTVISGGLEHCTAGYAIRRDSFPFHSIEYVARGSGRLKLRGRTHALSPGIVFTYGPGVPHEIISDPATPLVKYFVDFSGRASSRLLKSCRLQSGRVIEVFPPQILVPLLDELIRSGLRFGRQNAALCAKLLECVALKIASANAPAGGLETPAFTTYQQCRRHIEQHFLDLRTLEQVARECHIDKAYLCRLFRRYDHESPYQYLLRLKMNYAAERLQQTGAPVKQVAEATGFADAFHFSRVFRKTLGLAPKDFKRLRPDISHIPP